MRRMYKYLKAVLEGSLEPAPENVLIYATSNRRHLIREYHSDRVQDERTGPGHPPGKAFSVRPFRNYSHISLSRPRGILKDSPGHSRKQGNRCRAGAAPADGAKVGTLAQSPLRPNCQTIHRRLARPPQESINNTQSLQENGV